MMRQNLYDLTRPKLITLCAEQNFSSYHADKIWSALYERHIESLAELDSLRADVLSWLRENFELIAPNIHTEQHSSDNLTRKYLLSPIDEPIETVIMQFKDRYTACISTQVGCAMGCVFCATGQMGFNRHLSPGEIVVQVVHVMRELAKTGDVLRNIVLMGMGEPLHNYDNVMTALDIITDHKGITLAPRHITLSTVGIPDGIRRLADENRPINLAVSLHGATDAERQALVPPAKRWTLDKVMDACHYYVNKRGRRIFFEWTLIAGKNDSAEQAHRLGQLLKEIDCTINVIPLNPTNGYAGAPSNTDAVTEFCAILYNEYGLRCKVRQRRGIDIAAGCGQLAVLNS